MSAIIDRMRNLENQTYPLKEVPNNLATKQKRKEENNLVTEEVTNFSQISIPGNQTFLFKKTTP